MRHLVVASIVVFWLVMMSLLVEREVLPAWVEAHRPAYRALSSGERLPRRTQMGIYLNRRRVGTSRSVTRRGADGSLLIEGVVRMEAEVPIIRFRSRLSVRSRVRVDRRGRLTRFRIRTVAPGLDRTIEGEVAGGELLLTTRTGGRTEEKRVPFEQRDLLGHDLAAMEGLGDLAVGRRWFVQNVNPLTGRWSLVPVEVRRKETIRWRGKPVECFLVVSSMDGMESRAWVGPEGEVLRQELPLGLVLEREPFTPAGEAPAPHPAAAVGRGTTGTTGTTGRTGPPGTVREGRTQP